MTRHTNELSPLVYARSAGLTYLIIITAGIFAEFFVRSGLIVSGDAAATAGNIAASEVLFRIGIAGDIVMIIADIALALLLYMLLKPVNTSLSMLAAFFRLIQAAVLGANLLNLFFVVRLLGAAGHPAGFTTDQLNTLILLFLDMHSIGYAVGLVFFGMSLIILGYLVFRSGYLPKTLGVLLLGASAGYLADSFAHVLLTNYDAYKSLFSLIVFTPAFIAELSLCLWLLIKGVNLEQWQNRAAASA